MVPWMTIRLLDVSSVTMDDNQADRSRNGTMDDNHYKRSVLQPWITVMLLEVSTGIMDNAQADRGQNWYHGRHPL